METPMQATHRNFKASDPGTAHIVTGATGFLGRHFVARLLVSRPQDRVYCIVRANGAREDGLTARERLGKALPGDLPAEARSRLAVIEGDVTQPLCGLPASLFEDGIGAGKRCFWHSAASLEWEDEKREEILRTNVQGTRNAVDTALALRCDTFFHVSTAYTCGVAAGRIEEDRPLSVAHANNVYEASKIEGEQLLRARCAAAAMDHIVLRPGIILGTSSNYEPSGSYSGLYGFLRTLRRLGNHLGDAESPVKIHYEPDIRLGWIPVDQCTLGMYQCLVEHEKGELNSGAAVHLVGTLDKESARLGDVIDHILSRLGLTEKVHFQPHPIAEKTPFEAVVEEKLSFYATYMRSEKDFQSRLPNRLPVTLDMMRRFIDKEIELALR
jgi:nucleoside-diphosphate-sugar epimerase